MNTDLILETISVVANKTEYSIHNRILLVNRLLDMTSDIDKKL